MYNCKLFRKELRSYMYNFTKKYFLPENKNVEACEECLVERVSPASYGRFGGYRLPNIFTLWSMDS